MVPLWKYLVRKQPLRKATKLSLFIAFVGLGCISEFDLKVLNQGDVLGVISALFFAAYMLILDAKPQLTARPFTLNAIQCLFMAPLSLGVANYFYEHIDLAPLVLEVLYRGELTLPVLGIVMLGTCVSWLSYSAQTFAQNKLPAHVVGVILLLDSPLACLGGYFFLGETPSRWTLLGGALIFCAAVLMVATTKTSILGAGSNSQGEQALPK